MSFDKKQFFFFFYKTTRMYPMAREPHGKFKSSIEHILFQKKKNLEYYYFDKNRKKRNIKCTNTIAI